MSLATTVPSHAVHSLFMNCSVSCVLMPVPSSICPMTFSSTMPKNGDLSIVAAVACQTPLCPPQHPPSSVSAVISQTLLPMSNSSSKYLSYKQQTLPFRGSSETLSLFHTSQTPAPLLLPQLMDTIDITAGSAIQPPSAPLPARKWH